MHRHPAFWTDPETFDPERFREEDRSAQHRFAYIPFGGEPRVCIGRNFALMEIQLVVSSVVQRFQMAPVPWNVELTHLHAVPNFWRLAATACRESRP